MLAPVTAAREEGIEIETSWAALESNKVLGPKILGSQIFFSKKFIGSQNIWVKIGLVTAETFLIWTNVARTNIPRTNVTVAVKICSRWSQEPIFKFLSKSDQ